MRIRLFIIISALVGALVLGACGGSSSVSSPSPEPAPTPTTAPVAVPTPDTVATQIAATVQAKVIEDAVAATVSAFEEGRAAQPSPSSAIDAMEPSIRQLVDEARPAVIRVDTTLPMGGASGSGVIYDASGLAITNQHVIAGATSIMVTIRDSAGAEPRVFTAVVLGTDPSRDLAVIQINGSNFSTLELGTSSDVEAGDEVLALGFPLGLQGDLSVSRGIVSRRVNSNGQPLIQHDAKILPGNSGGPLLTLDGAVAGINTFVIGDPSGTTAEGLNVAIGAEDFATRLTYLEAGGKPEPANTSQYVNAAHGFSFNVPPGWNVVEDSPEVVFVFDTNSGAVASIQIDPDTSRFGDDEIWAQYWFFAGRAFVDQDTYQVLNANQGTRADGATIAIYEELFQRAGAPFMSRDLETFIYNRGTGLRIYFEAPVDQWDQATPVFGGLAASLVEPEPLLAQDPGPSILRSGTCVTLDAVDTYVGELAVSTGGGDVASGATAMIFQAECAVVGQIILEPPLIGSGAFLGQIAADEINFTVFAETSDAVIDFLYTGGIADGALSGEFSGADIEGTWTLSDPGAQ